MVTKIIVIAVTDVLMIWSPFTLETEPPVDTFSVRKLAGIIWFK